MELLILKSGEKYLRILDETFEFTGLNKASVFQLSDENSVIEKYNQLRLELKDLSIKKLTIQETDYKI